LVAFAPEGMLAWLNAARPEGDPEVKEVPATPGRYAGQLDADFRAGVAWWGGGPARTSGP
jgi:hypothetical protein